MGGSGGTLKRLRRAVRVLGWPIFARRVVRDGRCPCPPDRYDAIVVLGARVRDDGTPSVALERRLALGVALYQQGRADRLVLTGRGPGALVEASWMAEEAVRAGVPAGALIVEQHAMTTAENARYCARLLPPDARILIATDDTHLRRALREFRRHFTQVEGVGAPTWGRAALRQIVVEALKEAWREA